MKGKNNAGSALVEVLMSITILALLVVPICSGMLLSARVNAKGEAILRARLAVSSAINIMMAEGIDAKNIEAPLHDYNNLAESGEIKIDIVAQGTYYDVTVADKDDLVSVTTKIRPVKPPVDGEGGGT